jgi:hypothetical protein
MTQRIVKLDPSSPSAIAEYLSVAVLARVLPASFTVDLESDLTEPGKETGKADINERAATRADEVSKAFKRR